MQNMWTLIGYNTYIMERSYYQKLKYCLYSINCKHTESKTWPGENVNSRRIEQAVMDYPQWYSPAAIILLIRVNEKNQNK